MKKIIYTIFTMLCAAGAVSCSGFLDEQPLSNITDKNYYKTEKDAEGAINAIYEAVGIGSVTAYTGTGNANTPYGGLFFNVYWIVQDLFTDNAAHDNWLYANFDNFSIDETDGNVKNLWYSFYRAINTCNIAISRIPAIDMNADKRNHLVAEAKFWRGLMYGEMVKFWGDVPLCQQPTEGVDKLFGVVRTNQITVLTEALNDLQFAIDNLKSDYRAGYGRANSLIAQAVYAKVALILASKTGAAEDWDKVAKNCEAVIKSEKYTLYDSFAENFLISNEHGQESVLSINYQNTADLWGSQFNVALLPSDILSNSPDGVEGPSNANYWIIPTDNLYKSFAEGDTRRDVTVMKDYTYKDGSKIVFAESAKYPYYYSKYWDKVAEPKGLNSDQNYPYMRYSEVLLMYAEALNEINKGPVKEAYDAVNAVRDRAFQDKGTGAHSLSSLSYAQFRKALLNERRWELALEGSRWFDLVRLSEDFCAEIKKAKPESFVTEKNKLFPIPQYERLLNKNITQNEGY